MDRPPDAVPWTRLALPLALMAAAATGYQIILMRVFSYLHWHHFAFLMVSLALLGFGASGTFLALFPKVFTLRRPIRLNGLCLASALAMALLPPLTQLPWLRADFYLAFSMPGEAAKIILTVILFIVPFFLVALFIGTVLTQAAAQASRLYAADLAGSGLGGILALAALHWLLPEQLPAIVALLPFAAASLLTAGRKWLVLPALGTCLILLLAFLNPPSLHPSQFKDISYIRSLPQQQTLSRQPSAEALVEVVSAPALRYAPGLSLTSDFDIPVRPLILVNGNIYGPLPLLDRDAPALLTASTEQLAYALRPNAQSVLLLESEGWSPLAHAHSQLTPESAITVVEPFGKIRDLLKEATTGWMDNIRLVHGHPRTYLAHAKPGYDLIRLPTQGAVGGSAGVSSLHEQDLLTVEAISQAWRLLKPDGLLMVTGAIDHPVRIPLRLPATMLAGLREAGVENPGSHLMMIRGWGTFSVLISRQPVTSEEADAIRTFCRDMGFDPLWLPGLQRNEMSAHHQAMEDDWLNQLYSARLNGGVPDFQSPYFRLDAPTDDQPFFSQFLRPAALPVLAEIAGAQGTTYLELGLVSLLATLVLLTVLSAALILMPLTRLGWKGGGRWNVLFYFGGLGLGFMLLEIAWMQRVTLYLGNPVIAASIVICLLLICSGIGSLCSGWLEPRPRTIRIITIVIATLALLSGWGALQLLQWRPGEAIWMQWMIVILALAPMGFVMGFAFPLGLRALETAGQSSSLPWAWGINGCFSVMAPPLALLIAIDWGYSVVFALATLAYLLAALALPVPKKAT